MSELDHVKQALAEALGEESGEIEATNPRWLALMQEGVLVRLHIGRWRAKTRLRWHDLGIEVASSEDKELQEIINLGYKRLLPATILREIDSIESKARKWLEKKAYRTYWGFFVPVTVYQEWKELNESYVEQYFEARNHLVRNYDQIVGQVIEGYGTAARQAYDRLKILHPESVEHFSSRTDFVRAFVQGIRKELPSAVSVRESFYFKTELQYIPLMSQMAADRAEAERIRQQAETERLETWAEQEIIQDRLRAEQAKIDIEVQMARSDAQWKEQLMREMHRDVVDQARQQKEEMVDGFLRDVVVQLRSLVYDATTDVLGKIRDSESLPPRSVVQLKHLVDQVKSLNFYGDAEIEQMIEGVSGQLEMEAGDRNLMQIEANLRDIATVVRASLIGLGERPRAARNLGVADDPTPDLVRQARRGLGLDGEVEGDSLSGRQARLSLATG